jgi:hypothetical protein
MLAPLPTILHYSLSAMKIAFLSLIYAAALFTTLVPLIRISTLKTLSEDPYSSSYLTWSMAELFLGIIVVSLPSLSPLLKEFFDKGGLRTISVQSYESHDSFWGAKSYLRRVRERSSLWKRLVLIFGYGQFTNERDIESQQDNLRSPGSRLESRAGSRMESRSGSRMGSRLGRAGSSLGWLNGKSDEVEEDHDFGGILKTTEVVVSREDYEDHGREGRAGSGVDMNMPAPSRA